MARPTHVPALGPSTPMAVAGPLLLRARLADVRRYEGALASDAEPDPEVVHDLRVATRRLRVALDLFGGRRLRALERQVEALQDALGALRDVQVQRGWLSARARRLPIAAELARRVDQERSGAERKVRRSLRAWAGAVAPALERAAPEAGGRGRLGGRRTAKALRRAVARLERRAEDVEGDLAPRAAHALRIAARRLRDLAQLVAPGHRRQVRRLLAELDPVVDRLGALHDADVRLSRLQELAGSGTPGRQRSAARGLLREAAARRAGDAAALMRQLERWRGERFLREARRAFGRLRPAPGPCAGARSGRCR